MNSQHDITKAILFLLMFNGLKQNKSFMEFRLSGLLASNSPHSNIRQCTQQTNTEHTNTQTNISVYDALPKNYLWIHTGAEQWYGY